MSISPSMVSSLRLSERCQYDPAEAAGAFCKTSSPQNMKFLHERPWPFHSFLVQGGWLMSPTMFFCQPWLISWGCSLDQASCAVPHTQSPAFLSCSHAPAENVFFSSWLNRAGSRVEGQMSFRSALHISNKTWLTASWLQTLYSWWQHGRGTKDTAGFAEPKMSSAEQIIRRNHLFDLWAEHIWTEISEGE